MQKEIDELKSLLFEAYLCHLEKEGKSLLPEQRQLGFEIWIEFLKARRDPKELDFMKKVEGSGQN